MEVLGDDQEDEKSIVFSQLKPCCLELLQLAQNPKPSSPTIPRLLTILRTSPSDALQPFFDYTLFPLLLLLDAAVDCRSSQRVATEDKLVRGLPLKVSDNVAEGVLHCLEVLLNKFQLDSLDQMIVMLKKLTYAALLSPLEASEEFREAVIKCFRALILGLHPCSNSCCSCQQHPGLPMLREYGDLQISRVGVVMHSSEQRECLLSFLQSQAASAAVGHWLSILLKAADNEAERGHRGSANLRIEAFVTLRILVAKVGDADVLAFFLPGVVSQFAKVLRVAKTMISGAAGNIEAIGQAIRGLAEFLMIVLHDDANISSLDVPLDVSSGNGSESMNLLEELRCLPLKTPSQSKGERVSISDETAETIHFKSDIKGRGVHPGKDIGTFIVERSNEWIDKTSLHVNRLLSATFPYICVHPAKRVREGLLAAIQGLISSCSLTLKESRVMLLECLCVLVVDECQDISSTAQECMEHLFSSTRSYYVKHDLTEIFSRLIEKLPKTVLGSNESLALSHAQKLLAVTYYSGPRFLVDHLQSPVAAARFLDIFFLCLGQNLAFAGSLDKLISAMPSMAGYLQSVDEFRSSHFRSDSLSLIGAPADGSKSAVNGGIGANLIKGNAKEHYELPRMPPWFTYVGSQKLYRAVVGVLRFVGLSLAADTKSQGHLSVIADIPLGYLHTLISEVRSKQYKDQGWHYWYSHTGSGQLLRQASTAACVLNEIIYGVSEHALDAFRKSFLKPRIQNEGFFATNEESAGNEPYETELADFHKSKWTVSRGNDVRTHLIDCVGRILHEYLSSEVWDIPVDYGSFITQPDSDIGDISSNFFHDAAMLHQVIIEGIGIFSLCLGADFISSGFLHSSLYLLLENLTCSNFEVRCAADTVLHIIGATSGYSTVGHMVLENADYLVDSIVRQLRHLDVNSRVPNVIASLLSFIGMGQKVLPLLEEPIWRVSQELEILSRHKHPHLTFPFLKAVMEIAKASKREACSLPPEAESFSRLVKVKIYEVEKNFPPEFTGGSIFKDGTAISNDWSDANKNNDITDKGEWENILFQLSDSKRYRQTVGSIAASCLTAATPLLASVDQAACLVALDIVEDGIAAIAKVEEAYRHEKGTKEAIEDMLSTFSAYQLKDLLDVAEDDSTENRLLPAMNKVWPFLIACVKNNNVVVVRKCLGVVSRLVQICGGDFFSRRFHTDGTSFWKLLSTSAFQKKRNYKEERSTLQLPYRGATTASEESVAEGSSLKVQVAVLDMIADLSQDKRSASALEVVLKKVSGLVVGIACSGVVGLRDAAVNALSGLTSIDADLIWLLLADVYFTLKKKDVPSPPASHFPHINEILPPPVSSKEFLYVQYGGQSYGFDIDLTSVETVLKQLQQNVFSDQVYS